MRIPFKEDEMENKFYDLIYGPGEVEEIIKGRYPNAKIKDASDYIHTERFECEIEGVSNDEFYPFAIKEGFATLCFGFALLLESLKFPEFKDRPGEHKETKEKIEGWIKTAKADENTRL